VVGQEHTLLSHREGAGLTGINFTGSRSSLLATYADLFESRWMEDLRIAHPQPESGRSEGSRLIFPPTLYMATFAFKRAVRRMCVCV